MVGKNISLLDNAPIKFRTRHWAEISHKSRGSYKKGNQITFKISMLRSSLCDYSNAYILVSETITITRSRSR